MWSSESGNWASAVSRKAARTRWAMSSTSSAGNDEGLAELADADGRVLGRAGGQRGHVTGTFFHVIAATAGAE